MFKPQKGFQTKCLSNPADILIIGGAAGASKTFTMLLASLRYIDNPKYRAIFFRRQIKSLKSVGGIFDEQFQIYPCFGAKPNRNELKWKFPSGAEIQLFNLDESQPLVLERALKGLQFSLGFIDEGDQISEETFWQILSRQRSSASDIKQQLIVTTNPSPSWIKDMISWYLDVQNYPIQEKSGVIRHFVRNNGKLEWVDKSQEMSKSFSFIPGTVHDNKILLKAQPNYLANLNSLPEKSRKALLLGCWDFEDEQTLFKRSWFQFYNELPKNLDYYCITIDTATKTDDVHDYSVMCCWGYEEPKIGHTYGKLYLIDMLRGKWNYIDLRNKLFSFVHNYKELLIESYGNIIVEDANVGRALYEEMRAEFKTWMQAIVPVTRSRGYNKYFRAKDVQGIIQSHTVYLPSISDNLSKIFLDEVSAFSANNKHAHDDIVDNMMDAAEVCVKGKYRRKRNDPTKNINLTRKIV